MYEFNTFIDTRVIRGCSGLLLALLWFAPTSVRAADNEVATVHPPVQRGAALGLFSADPNWSYVDMLDEMKAAGVNSVAIVVPYYMKTALDVEIYAHPKYSMPMSTVRRTVKDARDRGMEIFLFPILRLEDESKGWRGALNPKELNRFFQNYEQYILSFAKLADELKIPLMSVGSELESMEVHKDSWLKVIAAVRAVYKGKLTYSANWDSYKKTPFFDALDYIGVTGYFELAEAKNKEPSVEDLLHAWRYTYADLMRLSEKWKKPLIFTEIGYLSQKGTASWPWKEGANEPLDLEIQRKCYEALRRMWDNEPRLAGVYLWNWFGWGGLDSKEYTPRNKPAAKETAKWYVVPKEEPKPGAP
jgi:hypothetical protein